METFSMDQYRTRTFNDDVQSSVFITIKDELVIDSRLSQEKGREITKYQTIIRKKIDENCTVEREFLGEDDKDIREPSVQRAYRVYLAKKQKLAYIPDEGTPVERLTHLSRERVEFYRFKDIFTVDRLASLTDSQCELLGFGVKDDRAIAKNFLKNTDDSNHLNKLVKELEGLKETIKNLSEENEEFKIIIRQLRGKDEGEERESVKRTSARKGRKKGQEVLTEEHDD